MTNRHGKRSVSDWDWLKRVHESLHAKPCFADLVVIVSFDSQFPSTPGGPIDIKAGTTVSWSHRNDDDLDHHWEVRHLEKRAAALLALLPAVIDGLGMLDAECWIEIHPDRIHAKVARSDGDPSDSTFNLVLGRNANGWTEAVSITAVTDMPLLDIAAATLDNLEQALAATRWNAGNFVATGLSYDEENEEIVLHLPIEAYGDIKTVPQTDEGRD